MALENTSDKYFGKSWCAKSAEFLQKGHNISSAKSFLGRLSVVQVLRLLEKLESFLLLKFIGRISNFYKNLSYSYETKNCWIMFCVTVLLVLCCSVTYANVR